MGKRGRAERIFGAASAALCVAALAGFALSVVETGDGGSVRGYELLALIVYAVRYGRESVEAGAVIAAFWLPMALGAALLMPAAVFAGSGRGERLDTAGKLCETALALTLFDLSFFALAADLSGAVAQLAGYFADTGDGLEDIRRGAGYWAVPVCAGGAAVTARAGAAISKIGGRSGGPDRMGAGEIMALCGSALGRVGALACFFPMVGVAADAGSGKLFGGALAAVGVGVAAWSDRFFGGMLFWYLLAGVLAVVGAFIAGSESRFRALPAAVTCALSAACLVLMRLETGSGAVALGDETVEVSFLWGWWLAVCALSAAAVCCLMGRALGLSKRAPAAAWSGGYPEIQEER